MIYVLALLIGVVAGLRTMTAPAAVSCAAYLGWIDLSASWLSFLGSIWAVVILVILAALELVVDQLPSTPSRKVPQQFGARILMGAVAGAAIVTPLGGWILGLIVGVIGAVIGTYAGAAARSRLAASFGKDGPAALIEDAVAIIGAYFIISSLPRLVMP